MHVNLDAPSFDLEYRNLYCLYQLLKMSKNSQFSPYVCWLQDKIESGFHLKTPIPHPFDYLENLFLHDGYYDYIDDIHITKEKNILHRNSKKDLEVLQDYLSEICSLINSIEWTNRNCLHLLYMFCAELKEQVSSYLDVLEVTDKHLAKLHEKEKTNATNQNLL